MMINLTDSLGESIQSISIFMVALPESLGVLLYQFGMIKLLYSPIGGYSLFRVL